jgi:hypothetical protein
MDEVIRVKSETIYLGDFPITVMQMPDGSYCLSKTDIAKIIGEQRQSTNDFLEGDSLLALPFKGMIFPPVRVPGKVGTPPIAVPIKVATAYWRYWDKKYNNVIAEAIMDACLQETIERRADIAFGILRSEDDRNQKFAATVENFVLNKAKSWDIAIDGAKPFIIEFYEHLYRIRGGEWAKRDPYFYQRPACVGTWTNKFIYDLFPGSIPQALREKYKGQNGNSRKYEFLSQEIGRSYLALHMASLLSVMRISPPNNWSRFESNVQKGIPSGATQSIQMELDFLIEIEEDCARRLEEGN